MNRIEKIKKQIHLFPQEPGCYRMRDKNRDIIYIGKAKNLRKRVLSYFHKKTLNKKTLNKKTELLIANVFFVDYIVTNSEIEALILEAELIRKNKPKFNIDLKHSVRYAYLLVITEEFPRIIIVRDKKRKGTYFGPFTDAMTREIMAETARRFFKIRTCSARLPHKTCLQYHIKRCLAPCIGKITKSDYQSNVKKAVLFLQKRNIDLVEQLRLEMNVYSQRLDFEKAKDYRDIIYALKRNDSKQYVALHRRYDQDVISFLRVGSDVVVQVFVIKKGIISDKKEYRIMVDVFSLRSFILQFYSVYDIPREIIVPQRPRDYNLLSIYFKERLHNSESIIDVKITVPKVGIKRKLLDLVEKNIRESIRSENPALVDLQKKLNLGMVPKVIECFDISNLGNVGLVGAMVQYRGNDFDKKNYRRFKINSTLIQDDFVSMGEVVVRRYRRLIAEKREFPDLILIDGGRGQLNVAWKQLNDLGLMIPIIGLAKKEELVYIRDEKYPLRFSQDSVGLRLLQTIRDEAHRFVLKYHHSVRNRRFFEGK